MRQFSYLLLFLLMIACSSAVDRSISARSTASAASATSSHPAPSLLSDNNTKRHIYLKPTSAWQSPHIWYWYSDNSANGLGSWPGSGSMDVVKAASGWYSYTYDNAKSWAGFLFNDGTASQHQSNNLLAAGSGCYVITSDSGSSSTGQWYELNTDQCPFNPLGTDSAPQVGADCLSGDFASAAILVTLDVRGRQLDGGARYTTNGSDPKTSEAATGYKKGDLLEIGGDLAAPNTVTLRLYARDSRGREARGEYQYRKVVGSYVRRDNTTILQGFYWYIKNPAGDDLPNYRQPEPESNLWEYLAKEKAEEIYQDGFSHVWLPPSGKGFITTDEDKRGEFNVGYAVYDHYDLGEFYGASHVRTKYGFKRDLIQAVDALHQRKIQVIADIVMNHMLGADKSEELDIDYGYATDNYALKQNNPWSYISDRNYNVVQRRIDGGKVKAFVDFDFANALDEANGGSIGPRRSAYSAFKWRAEHFTGMESYGTYYLFKGKNLGKVNIFPDMPPGSPYDYRWLRSDIILGNDIDLNHPAVRQELEQWTQWLVHEVGFDGFRVDAVRHMDVDFIKEWAQVTKQYMASIGKTDRMLMFGENWDGWNERLYAFLKGKGRDNEYNSQNPSGYSGINNAMALFDVPLHYDFQKIAGANVESKDISTLPDSGLLAKSPQAAITFVDNHDTVPTQSLASYIPLHTKLQAYAFILLNTNGTPCVYYEDVYKGNALPIEAHDVYTHTDADYLHKSIKALLQLRSDYVYGNMIYYRGKQILGAKIEGRAGNGGLVYLIRNNGGSNTTLDIPDDGAGWTLVAGEGDLHNFRLTGNWAVWIHSGNQL